MPGFPVVSSRAPRENSSPRRSAGIPGPSSSITISTGRLALDRDKHASAAIFRGILDEVAEHLVEVLPLDPDLGLLIAGDIDGHAFVKPVDRALDRLEAFPHARPRMGGGAASDRARPGEMVVDLAAHDERLAADGVGEVGRVARSPHW